MSVRILASLLDRDGVRGPVVLHHVRVLDRHVGGAPVEVLDRIAARGHHLLDQLVRVRDRLRRRVHELRLHLRPLRCEAIVRSARESGRTSRALTRSRRSMRSASATPRRRHEPSCARTRSRTPAAAHGSWPSGEHPCEHRHHRHGGDHYYPHPRFRARPPFRLHCSLPARTTLEPPRAPACPRLTASETPGVGCRTPSGRLDDLQPFRLISPVPQPGTR